MYGFFATSLPLYQPNAYAFHYIPRSNKFAPDQQLTERDELLPSVRPPELISPKYLSLTPFLIASWFHEGRSKSSSQRLGNIENAYIESLIRIAGTFDDLGVKSMDRRVNAVSLAVSFLISSKQLGCFDKISYIQRVRPSFLLAVYFASYLVLLVKPVLLREIAFWVITKSFILINPRFGNWDC